MAAFRQVTGDLATANIWATYPQTYVSVWTGLGDQILGTSLLMMCAMALSDGRQRGNKAAQLNPQVLTGLVVVLGFAFSLNCGCALNPARDLAPRFFTAIAGWGLEPFR
ncbi:hypothetical protein C0Q70_20456 [Pomacea canaliculata]|uniref:Aquaporin n=1 Tax=Pomacea canaliculata TaxID=400727 RepID=A0A2T7NFQ5_POMCA|nr:hypothetical protein C0Q70_20456 [Pomacea canaliculata]